MQRMSLALAWSPSWTIAGTERGSVVLSAGGDRRVAIDGLTEGTVGATERWWGGGRIEAAEGDERRLLDRLVALGAVVPVGAPGLAVDLVGDGDPSLLARLADRLGEAGVRVAGEPDALAVVVRTDGHWPTPPPQVHLGLDLGLHHTVVLGPLVVPGATACTRCAEQRAARRWGEPSLPPVPAVTRHLGAIADLLAIQVELVAAGTSPLVNATIAWDLERGTTDRQSVFKMVGCPRCDHGPVPGRVELAWAGPVAS